MDTSHTNTGNRTTATASQPEMTLSSRDSNSNNSDASSPNTDAATDTDTDTGRQGYTDEGLSPMEIPSLKATRELAVLESPPLPPVDSSSNDNSNHQNSASSEHYAPLTKKLSRRQVHEEPAPLEIVTTAGTTLETKLSLPSPLPAEQAKVSEDHHDEMTKESTRTSDGGEDSSTNLRTSGPPKISGEITKSPSVRSPPKIMKWFGKNPKGMDQNSLDRATVYSGDTSVVGVPPLFGTSPRQDRTRRPSRASLRSSIVKSAEFERELDAASRTIVQRRVSDPPIAFQSQPGASSVVGASPRHDRTRRPSRASLRSSVVKSAEFQRELDAASQIVVQRRDSDPPSFQSQPGASPVAGSPPMFGKSDSNDRTRRPSRASLRKSPEFPKKGLKIPAPALNQSDAHDNDSSHELPRGDDDSESSRDFTPGAVAVYEECYHQNRYYEETRVHLNKGSLTAPTDEPLTHVDSEHESSASVSIGPTETTSNHSNAESTGQAPFAEEASTLNLDPELAEQPELDKGADDELCKRRTIYLWLAVFCLVIIAIAVAIPLALKKDDDPVTSVTAPDGTPSPTTLPPASIANLESIDDFRTALGLSGDPALSDPNTDQYQALKWLASEDPASLRPYDTSRRVLIERYTVALLYFSTNGPGWRTQRGFLLEESVCSWNSHDDTFGNATVGILCQVKKDERVDHIYLGKCKIKIR